MLDAETVQCPYCWEFIELLVDTSGGEQEYVEDCSVCCNPITVRVHLDGMGNPEVEALGQEE